MSHRMAKDADGFVVKRSVAIAGHRTSVSLEEPFWDVLRTIAGRRSQSMQSLIGHIDAERGEQNLSSAIRVFVIHTLQAEISRQAEPTEGELESEAEPVPPEGSAAAS